MPVMGLLALGTSACGASSAEDAGGGGFTNGGGAPSLPATPSSLEFQPSDTLTLVPEEAKELDVIAQPPGVYQLRFALIGDLADAALDRSEAVTSPDGRAHFVLTAPSKNALFSVRASSGSAVSTQRTVSVSSAGFATVEVNPNYTGLRKPPYWVASAQTNTRCEDLVGNPPPDGGLVGQSLADRAPQIQDVPVGAPIAITLRAAWFASGCLNLQDLESDKTTSVTVPVKDRPLELSETNLDVALGLDQPQLDAFVAETMVKARQAFVGPATSDVEALLDAMAQSDPAFDAARRQQNWGVLLGATLRATGSEPLVGPISRWMGAGVDKLSARDTFHGHLAHSGTLDGTGRFTLDRVAGIKADPVTGFVAGIAPDYTVSWKAEPDDTVLLGAKLKLVPSELLAALADASSGSGDVPSALADTCVLVGKTLAGTGDAYTSCNATCVSKLCTNALVTIWTRVRNASSVADIATLEVSASGKATIDDHAYPRGFQGSWVGALTHGALRVSLGGPAQGSPPPPPN